MTINLLDLYNTAAAQEWAMYDSDAENQEEMELSLILALNKAIAEILYSYPFGFRKKTHVILTMPRQNEYIIPKGIILKDSNGNYNVKISSNFLKLGVENNSAEKGIPTEFYIKGNKICFYPIPSEKSIISIDYLTLAIGEDREGNEIYALKNYDDTLYIPAHLEELYKNAIISRTMLNSIASETDENYSAYKKQSETAYRLLIKYSKGIEGDKKVKI